MKSRGRKVKYYSENKISKLINDYLKINEPIEIIKYKAIFEFAKTEYALGKSDLNLSEDFWRKPDRQGRIAVDVSNEQRHFSKIHSSDYFEVLSTENTIKELSQDPPHIKKKMISLLKVNEVGYRKLIKKYEHISEKETFSNNEIKELKEEIKNLRSKNEIYEQTLFQWADISSSSDIDLVNVITTGKTRSKIVEELFLDMFTENSNRAFHEINRTKSNSSNVLEIKSNKKNTLVEDLGL